MERQCQDDSPAARAVSTALRSIIEQHFGFAATGTATERLGLSEVGAATIRRAAAVHPICGVQIEYSLISRRIEAAILPACRELGIGITAYGVLARGLISGHWAPEARR